VLLSIFTPTHHPTYLRDTYNSILRQDYGNWEWVLVPNGPKAHIPEDIRQDGRVRVVQGAEDFYNIGAIKRHACDACRGMAFIELDHDDLLVPGHSLQRIADALYEGAGFVFSDTACFKPDLKPHTWDDGHGWEHYDVDIYGRRLTASRCFDVSARSLAEIYYAPDHVRVWGKKAYYDAGGHNPQLSVGDDHELMIKTYLKGHHFQHTGACNYLYRMHQSNTVNARQKEIQTQVRENCMKYAGMLMREEVRRRNLPVVDMDEMWKDGWKFQRDLKSGFGNSDSVGLIVCRDLLQWCPQDLVAEFMNQAYDALVPGGYLEIRVPSTEGRAAWLDPAYKSQFNVGSFHVYCRREWAKQNRDIRCRFQHIQANNEFPSPFHERGDFKYAVIHLAALKGQRQPGMCHI
jgi:glycosyltransferase involved in cell wall biosynthesis